MIALAERFEPGVDDAIDRARPPLERRPGSAAASSTCSRPSRPANGAEAAAAIGRRRSTRCMHLYMLNRGILLTPFHMMALMSPATTAEQVDLHTGGLRRRRPPSCTGG